MPFNIDAPDDDIERVLNECPDTAKVRGMFLDDLQKLMRAVAPNHPALKTRYNSFFDYPMREFLQLVVEAAATLYPEARRNEGIRRLGLRAFPEFAATHIGRVVFLPLGNNPARVFAAASKAYNLTLKPSHIKILDKGNDFILNELKLKTFMYSYNLGVWQGAFESINVEGQVFTRRVDLFHAEYFITW